jgi:hypothetical protein
LTNPQTFFVNRAPNVIRRAMLLFWKYVLLYQRKSIFQNLSLCLIVSRFLCRLTLN